MATKTTTMADLEKQLESALNKAAMFQQQTDALQKTIQTMQARIFQLEMEIIDRETRLAFGQPEPPA